MPGTKKRYARAALDRRLGLSWERHQLAGAKRRPQCEVRLDRVELAAARVAALNTFHSHHFHFRFCSFRGLLR